MFTSKNSTNTVEMKKHNNRDILSESGASMLEYVVLILFMVLVAFSSVRYFGANINNLLVDSNTKIQAATTP